MHNSLVFCRELNKALRDEKRDQIKPFFPYLKLLFSALYKIPLRKLTLFRGEKRAVDLDSVKKDLSYVWWSITSCSVELEVCCLSVHSCPSKSLQCNGRYCLTNA